MPFNDFDVFYYAARAVLAGQDPYALSGVYYPFPLFLLFAPLAALPLPAAHAAWTVIELAIFVTLLRRRALYAALFMPVVLAFLMGQLIMPLLAMFALLRRGRLEGIATAWLLVKPQLVILLLPWLFFRWWKHDRRQFLVCGGIWGALLAASFVIQPGWVQSWWAVSGERLRTPFSPSLWGALSFLPNWGWLIAASAVAAGFLVWAYRRKDFDILCVVNLLVNPVIVSYDLTILTLFVRPLWMWVVLTLLSWSAFAASALSLWRGEGLAALVTLTTLAYLLYKKGAFFGHPALEQPQPKAA